MRLAILAALLLAPGLARADGAAPDGGKVPGPRPKGGKALYAALCACCHDADGRGVTAYGKQHGCPDFTSAEWMSKHPEADLIASVTDGQLEAEMPAFRGQLSADEIKAVVSYIQKLAKPTK